MLSLLVESVFVELIMAGEIFSLVILQARRNYRVLQVVYSGAEVDIVKQQLLFVPMLLIYEAVFQGLPLGLVEDVLLVES